MALIEVGDIYINESKLTGASDVAEIPPPSEGMPTSYSFKIYLEGSTTAVTTHDKGQADSLHDKVVTKMSPQFRFATGRATFMYTAVNSIGPVGDDPVPGDKFEAAYNIQMDGVTLVLQYTDFAAATAARKELIDKVSS